MRADYLFELARVCNVPPVQVDALSLYDFFNLITGIDQLREMQKKVPNG